MNGRGGEYMNKRKCAHMLMGITTFCTYGKHNSDAAHEHSETTTVMMNEESKNSAPRKLRLIGSGISLNSQTPLLSNGETGLTV